MLRDRIALDDWNVLGLSVRLHGIAAPVDGVVLFVNGVAPSPRDGAQFLVSLPSAGITLNGPAPKLFELAVPLTGIQTPDCQVVLQATTPVAKTAYVRISVDMLLKAGA